MKRIKINNLRTLVTEGITKTQAVVDSLQGVQDSQSLEIKHHNEGRLQALEAIHEALQGDTVLLQILCQTTGAECE